jgi:hypothetical protein
LRHPLQEEAGAETIDEQLPEGGLVRSKPVAINIDSNEILK